MLTHLAIENVIISLSVGDKKAFFFLFKEKLMITAVLMFTQTSESMRVMRVYMFTSYTCLVLDLGPEWGDGWRWSGSIPHGRHLPFGYDVDGAEIRCTFGNIGRDICSPKSFDRKDMTISILRGHVSSTTKDFHSIMTLLSV